VRVATVISIGTATIAAAIGAGGLGTYIFRGLRMNDTDLILAGAIPAALMALAADGLLGWLERALGSAPRSPRASRRTRPVAIAAVAAAVLLVVVGLSWGRGRAASAGRVVVASKDFTEQVIVAELIAQLLEKRTNLRVERRFELGGDLAHRGLLSGEIDVYVEYTGTAWMAILKERPLTDPAEVYRRVQAAYQDRFAAEWLPPLGFNNTFAILVRGDEARRLGLRTVSDGAAQAPQWKAAFGQDFISREDGYPGFARVYGLRFAEPPREMDLSLTYRALASRQVDLIAGNSTDGLIDKLDLFQLEDDRRYFPPYQAAPVLRSDTAKRHPEVAAALRELAGAITDQEMRRLNHAVDGERQDPKQVAREFLERLGK
jgi:osmoprotectant transport system permease protein